MEIKFTKRNKEGHIIACKRSDGSETWMQISSFFAVHDLCHYAVETELGMQHAFYGMLDAGANISDFELPKDERTFQLTDQALFAEQMVNLLTIEYNQGEIQNFTESLREIYRQNRSEVNMPEINEKQVTAIRNSFESLANQWHGLSEGESIMLKF
jgi:hypothetical protein